MKIILSRKGFDSSNGGCPSPIMPDGTLLSMPIPSEDDKDKYSELEYQGIKYSKLLKEINPGKDYSHCHVDPDLRGNRVKNVPGWVPAFGQMNSAQGILRNAGIGIGDIFLFFGWFRKIELFEGKYRFVPKNVGEFYDHADLHVIYGYMQIGDMTRSKEDLKKYPWHPHSKYESEPNVIYTASRNLSMNPKLAGYGTLNYRQDRVLTMENCTRANWNPYPFMMPEYVVDNRKNSSKNGGLYYSGIWQELVFIESKKLNDWVKSILS